MREVEFLGFRCPETKDAEFGPPAVLPPLIKALEWSMTLEAQKVLDVSCVLNYGSAAQISLHLRLLTRQVNDVLVLDDGIQEDSNTTSIYLNVTSPIPANPNKDPGLSVKCGPLLLKGEHASGWVRVTNKRLMVGVAKVDGVPIDDRLPVRLTASSDSARRFVSPDMANSLLEVLAGAVVLQTATPAMLGDGTPWQGLLLNHVSERFTVDLLHPPREAEFYFTAAPTPLPLHVEPSQRNAPASDANPLKVPLKVQGHRFRLRLFREPDKVATILREIALHPVKDTLTMTTAALAGIDNVPKEWIFGDVPASGLGLRLRIADTARCGGLMLDHGLAADKSALTLAIGAPSTAGALHGELDDSLLHASGLRAALRCQCLTEHRKLDPDQNPYPELDLFSDSTLAEGTAPHLLWESAGVTDDLYMEHARPGATYRLTSQQDQTRIASLRFDGPALAMPLLPMTLVDQALDDKDVKSFRQMLDAVITGTATPPVQVTHETQRTEAAAAAVHVASAFLPTPGLEPDEHGNTFTLAAFEALHDYGAGVLKVGVNRPAGADPDYVVLHDVDADGHPVQPPSIALDAMYDGVTLGGSFNGGPFPMPRAILKFTRSRAIKNIVDQIGDPDLQKGFEQAAPVMPDHVMREDWTGVIFFDVGVRLNDELLKKIIPGDVQRALRFSFVAASPRLPGQGGGYSVAAHVSWTNTNASYPAAPRAQPLAPGSAPDEAAFLVYSVEGAWDNSQLKTLVIRTLLRFDGCFGLTNPKGTESPNVWLDGNFDSKTNSVEFAARADQPIEILPDDVAADTSLPIRQVTIRGGTITLVRDKAMISLDGSVDIRKFDLPGVIELNADGTEISFNGLGLSLPGSLTTAGAIYLNIDYPSLRLNFDGPKFTFGPLRLTLAGIGIDFHGDFPWGSLVRLRDGDISNRNTLLLELHIELMKLPAIAAKTIERLTFNLQLGLPTLGRGASWNLNDARAAIGALGFDGLDLDLFRFIEITAKRLVFDNATGTPPTATLTLDGVQVKVLNYVVIPRIDKAFFFSRGGESGFYVQYVPAGRPKAEAFTINWAVIGHNVSLPVKTVQRLLEIDPGGGVQDPDPPTLPADPIPAAPGSGSNWLVGAAVSAMSDLFQGRFIYDEAGTVGLALKAGFLKDWFGLDLAIAVNYARGKRREEDTFAVAVTIPHLTVGDIHFTGGVVAFQFQVDGGFLLDLGYPWPIGATRQWYRALGAIITPFQGSGGFYIERRNLYESQGKIDHLAGGYAVQAGLGAAFGGGAFTAWVTIGLYATLDGDVYFSEGKVVALRVTGAVGVLFRGHGELNFWIISVSVDISVSAEASTTVAWVEKGQPVDLLPGVQPGADPILRIDFTVYASASASACIRLGFVNVCRGISVAIPMRAAYSLTL